ncbi:hypothetical protein [Rhodospirillum centenum]|uniref:Uncharacterized protein n=1 Tax=Rhodospirillum centenum (strain ATCC 51521 / SW) TaxID=414684 RepID=B6IU18_RHOCS|nr:hypothetical protein [Rhodospirillum centenum]ACI99895.1 hypothetical protein RC1_2514 [Rhodospirillum centenum SW]
MTDQTFQTGHLPRTETFGREIRCERAPGTGFFARRTDGVLRTLYEDFRAVPAEAWIILAVATVMSNLFIALA